MDCQGTRLGEHLDSLRSLCELTFRKKLKTKYLEIITIDERLNYRR